MAVSWALEDVVQSSCRLIGLTMRSQRRVWSSISAPNWLADSWGAVAPLATSWCAMLPPASGCDSPIQVFVPTASAGVEVPVAYDERSCGFCGLTR